MPFIQRLEALALQSLARSSLNFQLSGWGLESIRSLQQPGTDHTRFVVQSMPRRCVELSKLPKITRVGVPKSINFSLNVPGTASPYQGHPPTGTDLVDPHHPWARLPRGQIMKQFLQWGNPLFYLRAMPKAVLYKPKEPRPDPPYSPPPNPWPKNRRINMALLNILPKTLHKSAVIRRAVVKKLKDVFMLVITRGADVQTDRKGNQLIVFKEEQAGGHWILEDWVYVVKPTLKLYQAPHAEIIQHVRTALYHISAQLKKGLTNPHLGVRPKLGVRSDGNNQTQYEKLTSPLPDRSRSNRPVMPGLQPPSSRDGFRKRTEAVEAVKLQPPRHNIGRIPRADSVKLSPPKGRSPSGDVSVGSLPRKHSNFKEARPGNSYPPRPGATSVYSPRKEPSVLISPRRE